MRNESDRRAPKFLFLGILVVFFYLAFFGFDLVRAYDYAVNGSAQILADLGILPR